MRRHRFRHAAFNGARKAKCLSSRFDEMRLGVFLFTFVGIFRGGSTELKWAIETRDLPTLKGWGWLDKHRARDEVR